MGTIKSTCPLNIVSFHHSDGKFPALTSYSENQFELIIVLAKHIYQIWFCSTDSSGLCLVLKVRNKIFSEESVLVCSYELKA